MKKRSMYPRRATKRFGGGGNDWKERRGAGQHGSINPRKKKESINRSRTNRSKDRYVYLKSRPGRKTGTNSLRMNYLKSGVDIPSVSGRKFDRGINRPRLFNKTESNQRRNDFLNERLRNYKTLVSNRENSAYNKWNTSSFDYSTSSSGVYGRYSPPRRSSWDSDTYSEKRKKSGGYYGKVLKNQFFGPKKVKPPWEETEKPFAKYLDNEPVERVSGTVINLTDYSVKDDGNLYNNGISHSRRRIMEKREFEDSDDGSLDGLVENEDDKYLERLLKNSIQDSDQILKDSSVGRREKKRRRNLDLNDGNELIGEYYTRGKKAKKVNGGGEDIGEYISSGVVEPKIEEKSSRIESFVKNRKEIDRSNELLDSQEAPGVKIRKREKFSFVEEPLKKYHPPTVIKENQVNSIPIQNEENFYNNGRSVIDKDNEEEEKRISPNLSSTKKLSSRKIKIENIPEVTKQNEVRVNPSTFSEHERSLIELESNALKERFDSKKVMLERMKSIALEKLENSDDVDDLENAIVNVKSEYMNESTDLEDKLKTLEKFDSETNDPIEKSLKKDLLEFELLLKNFSGKTDENLVVEVGGGKDDDYPRTRNIPSKVDFVNISDFEDSISDVSETSSVALKNTFRRRVEKPLQIKQNSRINQKMIEFENEEKLINDNFSTKCEEIVTSPILKRAEGYPNYGIGRKPVVTLSVDDDVTTGDIDKLSPGANDFQKKLRNIEESLRKEYEFKNIKSKNDLEGRLKNEFLKEKELLIQRYSSKISELDEKERNNKKMYNDLEVRFLKKSEENQKELDSKNKELKLVKEEVKKTAQKNIQDQNILKEEFEISQRKFQFNLEREKRNWQEQERKKYFAQIENLQKMINKLEESGKNEVKEKLLVAERRYRAVCEANERNVRSLQREITDLKERRMKEKREIESEKEKEVSSIRLEIQNLSEKHEKRISDLEEMNEREKNNLREKIEFQQKVITDIKKNEVKEIEESRAKISELKNSHQIQMLELEKSKDNEILQLRTQSEKVLANQKEELAKKLELSSFKKINELQNSISILRGENEKFGEEVTTLRKENKKLRENQSSTILTLERRLEQVEVDHIEQLNTVKLKLENEKESVSSQLRRKLSSKDEENSKLRALLSEKENFFNETREENNMLVEKVKLLEDKLKQLEVQLKDKSSKVEEERVVFDKEIEQLESVRNDIRESEEDLINKRNEIQRKNSEVTLLVKQRKSEEDEIIVLENNRKVMEENLKIIEEKVLGEEQKLLDLERKRKNEEEKLSEIQILIEKEQELLPEQKDPEIEIEKKIDWKNDENVQTSPTDVVDVEIGSELDLSKDSQDVNDYGVGKDINVYSLDEDVDDNTENSGELMKEDAFTLPGENIFEDESSAPSNYDHRIEEKFENKSQSVENDGEENYSDAVQSDQGIRSGVEFGKSVHPVEASALSNQGIDNENFKKNEESTVLSKKIDKPLQKRSVSGTKTDVSEDSSEDKGVDNNVLEKPEKEPVSSDTVDVITSQIFANIFDQTLIDIKFSRSTNVKRDEDIQEEDTSGEMMDVDHSQDSFNSDVEEDDSLDYALEDFAEVSKICGVVNENSIKKLSSIVEGKIFDKIMMDATTWLRSLNDGRKRV